MLDGSGIEYGSRIRVWEELLVQKHLGAHADSNTHSNAGACLDPMRGRKRALFVHWQDDRTLWREHDCKQRDQSFHQRHDLQQHGFWH